MNFKQHFEICMGEAPATPTVPSEDIHLVLVFKQTTNGTAVMSRYLAFKKTEFI